MWPQTKLSTCLFSATPSEYCQDCWIGIKCKDFLPSSCITLKKCCLKSQLEFYTNNARNILIYFSKIYKKESVSRFWRMEAIFLIDPCLKIVHDWREVMFESQFVLIGSWSRWIPQRILQWLISSSFCKCNLTKLIFSKLLADCQLPNLFHSLFCLLCLCKSIQLSKYFKSTISWKIFLALQVFSKQS